MILVQAFQTAALTLEQNGIKESHHEARILLQNMLNLSPAEVYSQPELSLSHAEIERLQQLIKRRIYHEPNAYIVGNKEFYGTNFHVDNRVMIPRPETELLVEEAIAFIKHRANYPSSLKRRPVIADIGTGCGAIAISLALNLPKYKIYATDISPAAIKVAEVNCNNQRVAERVYLLQGNLLEPLPETVDLVIANLPYIKSSDLADLDTEIVSFEPRIALDGGRDGLQHIRCLLVHAKTRVQPQGCILLEIGDRQDKKVVTMAKRYLPTARYELIPDLGGINRVLKIAL